jgi:hypothetical protein
MVVLDITNLSKLALGIVAFRTDHLAVVPVDNEREYWDPVEDDPPLNDPVPTLQKHRPREPLTARSYMKLYYGRAYYEQEERNRIDLLLTEMDRMPLVDPIAMDCMLTHYLFEYLPS